MILWRTDGNLGKDTSIIFYLFFFKFYEYGDVHVMNRKIKRIVGEKVVKDYCYRFTHDFRR